MPPQSQGNAPYSPSSRTETVLLAVVGEYLRDATPVGSRTVSKMLEQTLSPATIRNVMADLEEVGLLQQPHTSAGRVPTAQGLRHYLDHMMRLEPLSDDERAEITSAFEMSSSLELNSLLLLASQILSSSARNVCMTVAPAMGSLTYTRIELILLSPHRVLVLFVSSLGFVTQKIVTYKERVTQDDLNQASRYLTGQFKGFTLEQIEQTVLEMTRQYERFFHEYSQRAVALASKVFPLDAGKPGVFVEGTSHLLDNVNVTDLKQLKEALEVLENRTRLIKILKNLSEASGITITLGPELQDPCFGGMSLISAPYQYRGVPLGVLSVLGPTPLPYARTASLVGFIAREVNRLLETNVESTLRG